MARSIAGWYADHTHDGPDGSSDDEYVEPQAPWDLQAPGLSTTRPVRRDAGMSSTSASTSRSRRTPGRKAGTGSSTGRATTGGGAANSVSKVLRRKILAAARMTPRADAESLVASLKRAGTSVTVTQVLAVTDRALPTALRSYHSSVGSRVSRETASEIRRAARADPQIGHKRLTALLRTQGMDVTRAQVAEVLRRPKRAPAASKPPEKANRPAMTVKVTASAQTSRIVHETPLCQSCGMRLSLQFTCRCS